MSTTILLVRHADVHNPGRLFYGRLPRFRLSDLGRRQASFLADYLKDVPIVAFYTSPMLRARQTARILASRHPGVPLHRATPLIEVRTGWMGRVETDIPPVINLYEPRHSPTDETIQDVWHRVDAFIRRLVRRHHGQIVCLVSHGDPVVVAHAGYLGLPLTLGSIRGSFYPQKCSVTTLAFDGNVSVAYRDVIGELAPELRAPH
ncbi:MAG TPA: histidine phosphatase family protein [Chloroflexota bacterium]|nr:histidine phosphatase family protein [Chloroflexota bacterium]